MLIIPAIDIKGGRCVRLFRGEMDKETVYAEDPLEAALSFREQGARFLHLVDLDGAVAGHPVNLEAVRRIVAAVGIPVELGGGLRDLKTVEEALSLGVERVILGTAAVRNPGLVAECCRRCGERVAVGIDSRNGLVAVEGWLATSERTALEVALEVKALGVRRVIYTDTWRDGALSGPNLAATGELARRSGLKLIASGGVSSLEDIAALKELEPDGVEGAILGRALYTGDVNLGRALALAGGEG